jgi:lipocalin
VEFYSTTKKNEILSFAGKWMELENVTLREVSQVQKVKTAYSVSYVEYIPNTNTSNILKKQVMLRGGHI